MEDKLKNEKFKLNSKNQDNEDSKYENSKKQINYRNSYDQNNENFSSKNDRDDYDRYYYKNERRSDGSVYGKEKIDKSQAVDRLKQIEIEKAKLQKMIDEKEALMKRNEQYDTKNIMKIKKSLSTKDEKINGN
ncbi:hypothetical protein BCR32DRAFT_241260 [Anaeromyces robustus]|uniref:Uncharacterized protein n=1 Tax=Anaeromyces robustus TaxID=1754192 RepID=A0A1Y1XLB2_9FUNG|nr:hypothetical protein BCR32DRAFT_241260 [Anaeromyces robustus]|eukprot:ORX86124.1 hypothetical protein BCR32DRAFT_241260 [Anaeromyces robustus]